MSIHVQIPANVRPGEMFYVVVGDMEYEIWAPENSKPGEMVVMSVDEPRESSASASASAASVGVMFSSAEPSAQVTASHTSQAVQASHPSQSISVPSQSQRPDTGTDYEPSESASAASVATDASLVQVRIPENCSSGDTFFATVYGLEFEILVPRGCQTGDLIELEVPSKRAIAKFGPESASAPSVLDRSLDRLDRSDDSNDSFFAELCVPQGVSAGQSFVAAIDGSEFDVPVPEGYGPGDILALQLPSRGAPPSPLPSELDALRQELQEMRQELQQVRQMRDSRDSRDSRERDWRERDPQLNTESKSSADSFIEILIPPDCYPGDTFVVEVDDMEFQMAVPDGCCPGETIYMDLREGGGYTANSLSSKQKSNSRPPSAVRKLVKEELVATEEKDETITASPSVPAEILEITIPEDCYPGDPFIIEVNDVELELTVPAGCQPGEVIYMDLLPEGTLTNSRPASATTADDKSNSRPASAKKKTSVVTEQVSAENAADQLVEIVVPKDCQQGDNFVAVFEMKMAVPEGCQGGDVLIAPLPRAIPEHQLDINQTPAHLTKTLEAMGLTQEIEQLKKEVEDLKSAPLPRTIPEHELAIDHTPAHLTKTLEAMGLTQEIEQLKKEVEDLKSAPLPRAIPEHELAVDQTPAHLTKTLEAMGLTQEIEQLKKEVEDLKSAPLPRAIPEHELAVDQTPAHLTKTLEAMGLTQEIQQLKKEVAHLNSAPLPRTIPEHQLDINQPAHLTKTLEAMGWTKEIQQLKREVEHLKSAKKSDTPRSNGVDMVDVTIPEGCFEGDIFFAEASEEASERSERSERSDPPNSQVNGVEFKVVVPEKCGPGTVIEMEVPSSLTREGAVTRSSSKSFEMAQESLEQVVEVTIPPGACAAGGFIATLRGKDYEISVPEGGQEGDTIEIDLRGLDTAPPERHNAPPERPHGFQIRSGLSEPSSSRSASQDSIYEVVIPPFLKPGDMFLAQLNEKDYEIPVPDHCQGGDVIEVDIAGLSQSSSAHGSKNMFEVDIPETLSAGDAFTIQVDGKEFEILVPEGYEGGDQLAVEFAGLSVPSSARSQSGSACSKVADEEPVVQRIDKTHVEQAMEPVSEIGTGESVPEGPKEAEAAEEARTQVEAAEAAEAAEAEAVAEAAEAAPVVPSIVELPEAAEAEAAEAADTVRGAERAGEASDEEMAAVSHALVRAVAPNRRIRVTVMGAKALQSAGWIGQCDPYITCKVKETGTFLFATPPVQDTINPVYKFSHDIESFLPTQSLEFTVWNAGEAGYDNLGFVQIFSSSFLPSQVLEDFSLKGSRAYGSLEVKFQDLGLSEDCDAALAELRRQKSRLRIRICQVKSLRNARQVEGDDPYCVCKLWNSPAALFRTPVVPNASNALWNHEQEVEYTPGEPLEFRVYDVDQAEELDGDFLGTVKLLGDHFFPQGLDANFKLLGKRGRGLLKLQIENLGPEQVCQEQLRALQVEGAIRLRVFVLKAENLKFGDSEQSANPYCVCSSGGETLFRTGVLGDTLSPTWNHTFDVPEYLAGTDLEFAVFEEDDGDESIFLGSAHLLSSRFCPDGCTRDLTLTGRNGSGTLSIKIENIGASAQFAAQQAALQEAGAYRLAVSVLGASELIADSEPFCVCRVVGRDEPEFETAAVDEKVNPEWNHEHVISEYRVGEALAFDVLETRDGEHVKLGHLELPSERFFQGFEETLCLTGRGCKGQLHVKIQSLGTVAEHAAKLEEERIAAEAAAEAQRIEAEAQARREEEEREAARVAAKKAKEEAERQRLEDLKQKALEEAEQAVREEEARIKRSEAERKGKEVISVTVVNDDTEEYMAKASLRLGCKVLELAQVCIREARLSVAPVIFSEPKPEPKMVRGKMELRERFPLATDDTLLEAGVENNAVLRAKISPAVITASKDCTARIWNAETGKCELVLEGHSDAVCSACISPDCRYVATSSEDASARLWYVDSGRCARVLLDHKEAVYSTAFSPDSKQVVTASEDGSAKIWVVKTGLCKLTLKGHNFAVLWAAFSPDGRSVTTTSSDGTLKIWNAKTGVCDRTLLGQKPVYLASFATDGSTFVTASGDSTAKICDLVTGDSKIVLQGHDALVLGASYAPSCPAEKDDG
ncbi:unnamed protein product [Effrenium voratum]|nr:unnamed protein product [Effrenium voratum]